jgi:hypothetical protein
VSTGSTVTPKKQHAHYCHIIKNKNKIYQSNFLTYRRTPYNLWMLHSSDTPLMLGYPSCIEYGWGTSSMFLILQSKEMDTMFNFQQPSTPSLLTKSSNLPVLHAVFLCPILDQKVSGGLVLDPGCKLHILIQNY